MGEGLITYQHIIKYPFKENFKTNFARSATLGDTSCVRLILQDGTCQILSIRENPILGPHKILG